MNKAGFLLSTMGVIVLVALGAGSLAAQTGPQANGVPAHMVVHRGSTSRFQPAGHRNGGHDADSHCVSL
jgi:hypothetical protein